MAPPELKDWARLAAFIDGEGCINVHRQVSYRGGKKTHHIGHTLLVRITNTDPRLMEWLKNTFGGIVCRQKDRGCQRHVCFNWQPSRADTERILRNILDLLVLKRQQAEIGLAFRATFHKKNYERLAPGVADFRENCKEQINGLNSGNKHRLKIVA